MADPLSSTFQTQDIPEYLRPFRNALLSSAFSSVYTPEAMKNFLPNATYFNAYTQNQPNQQQNTSGNTGDTGTTGNERNDAASNEESNKNAIFNALNMVSGKMPKLPGLVWDTNTRTYVPEAYKTIKSAKGGELNPKEDPIQKILDEYQGLREKMPVGLMQAAIPAADAKSLTGGVTYPEFKNPFNVTRGPSQTSSYTIGDNISPDITRFNPRPVIAPGVVPPVGTGVTTPPGGGGVGTIGGPQTGGPGPRDPSLDRRVTPSTPPGTPGTPVRPPGTPGTGVGTGGGGGIGNLAQIVSSGLAGTTTANQGAGGYNPLQYATDDQARGLASLLGGTNQSTNTSGPLNVPSQNQLGFGGSDTFNAGLIQQQLRPGQTPSEMTSSLARLRAEVSGSGGDTSSIDRLIQQNNQAYASGARVSPVGQPPATTAPPATSKPPATTTPPATEPPPDRGTTPLPRSGVPGLAPTLPDVIYDRIPEPDVPPPVNPDPDIPEPYIPEPYNPEPESYIPEPEVYNPETYSPETSVPEPDGGGIASLLGSNQSNTPESNTPESYTPDSYTPESYTPEAYTPDSYTPESYTPEVSAPESYAPESYTPEYYAPEASAPESYTPDYGSDQSLASFDIGDDGRVNNYRKGGSVRRFDEGGPVAAVTPPYTPPFSLGGFGAPQTPVAGGFGGPNGAASLFKTANPKVEGEVQNLFNAPPVYGGQRTMLFGQDFGQGNEATGYTSSNLTRNALSGVGGLQSIYDNNGQIRQGTDFSKGVSAINSATDLSGNAAEEGSNLIGASRLPPEQSYLMSLMPGIQGMGFKDAIKVNPIQAPNMINPMGVTAAQDMVTQMTPQQLGTFQMAQPMGVSGQNIDVLGQLGGLSGTTVQGLPQLQQFQMQGPEKVTGQTRDILSTLGGLSSSKVQGVPQVQQFQMQGPERVTGQTRDILSTLGGLSGATVQGVPQVQQFQMQGPERVGSGQTQVDQFGQQQAQQYMSPYMDAVTEMQKRDASRTAGMQKAGRGAAAVRAGAFGGSRQAIQEGMAEEALQRQLGDIDTVGRQRAFENAQSQFDRDRAASLASQQTNVQSALQAALANQQSGLTAGRENLGANLSTQQLGAQTALQAALANQQSAQQAALTGYGTRADILRSQSAQDLQAALANQQAGLATGRENLGAQLSTQQLGNQSALQAALANQQAEQQSALTGYGTRADILRSQSAQDLQASLANQQAGLATGRENLGANLNTQQLGAQQALQAALANQQSAQQAALTGYGTRADVLRSQSAQNLQADLANQQAGLTAGRENLGARLGLQQQGAQQALQAQLANQQAGLTAGQANLQSSLATQQLGVQSGLEAAKATQYGDISMTQMQLDAAKQASAEQEAARQRQFNNRLAAIQQGSASAGALAGMGGQMMSINPAAQQLELQRLAAMQQAGGAVDARTQEAMNLQYQDFINQQNAPYQQMNFLQGIMSGIPTGMQTENVQFARPASGGLSGLLTAGAGLASNYYANQKT